MLDEDILYNVRNVGIRDTRSIEKKRIIRKITSIKKLYGAIRHIEKWK